MQKRINLNEQVGHPSSVVTSNVEVLFTGLEKRLCEEIPKWTHVSGCVAWLTNHNVLRALSEVSCSIVVQKEDFLRPDSAGTANDLRKAYMKLRCKYDIQDFGFHEVVKDMRNTDNPYYIDEMDQYEGECFSPEPIRCFGVSPREKSSAMPRMHNKFLIFCEEQTGLTTDPSIYLSHPIPKLVWTGSYNISHNAEASLENAVILSDPGIVSAYWEQWMRIQEQSEPLNWKSRWVQPEYRVGQGSA